MNFQTFKEEVFAALRISYFENREFRVSMDENVTRLTEYFVTVNLCKKLAEWNTKQNRQFQIEAEMSTRGAYRNCFDIYRQENEDDIFSESIFSVDSHEYSMSLAKIRDGRIDIAITKMGLNDKKSTEYIFELKAINPSSKEIRKDVVRIQNFLDSSVPNFDNSLKSGFIVFIMHENNSKLIQDRSNLEERLENYLERLRQGITKIINEVNKFEIYTHEIDSRSGENLVKDLDHSEAAQSTFYAVSIVVEITRNPK